jgi:hypothetical protein
MKLPVFIVAILLLTVTSCEKKSNGEKFLDNIHDQTEEAVKDVDKATKQVVDDSETEGKKSKTKLDKLFKKKRD